MNMTSTFETLPEDGKITRSGKTDAKGIGDLANSNGRTYPIEIQGYGRFSGAHVAPYPNEPLAIGWGRKAKTLP